MKRDFDIGELIGGMADTATGRSKGTATVPKPMSPISEPKGEKTVKTMSWQIDIGVLDQLDLYAKRNGFKRNAVVERAIREYLNRNEG